MQERIGETEESKIKRGFNTAVDAFRIMGTIAKESFLHPRGTTNIIYNSRTREIKATTEPLKIK